MAEELRGMRMYNISTFKCLFVLGLIAFVSGCANDKPKPKAGTRLGGTSTTTSGDAMCSSLQSHAINQSDKYSEFVTQLCSGTMLSDLRSSRYAFTNASATPNLVETSTNSGKTSTLRVWAMSKPSTDPLSYYNFMRLQISRPTDYDTIFESDINITYTVSSATADTVQYKYINKKDELVVEYGASSNFYTVAANQVYLVSSDMDTSQPSSVVQNFKALQIINKAADGTLEVFATADQTYDNQGDHASTTKKASDSFKEEMQRAMRNSTKATEANKFFP